MATWPVTLPGNFLAPSYQEAFADNTIRSTMDVGPPKVRRRSTSGTKPISGVMYMTPDQLATLTTFFETTLYDGSLPFDWTHPRLNTAISCQFKGAPAFRRYDDDSTIGWMVSITLEVLP